MNREDVLRMAREAGFSSAVGKHIALDVDLERFAALVAAAERERIKAANAPEIEKINAHFKALEEAVAAEREECAKAVLDDAWALTFQTFGQYRTALAAAIRARSKQ